MSNTITCPVCGKRDLGEFRFGNENRGPVLDQGKLSLGEYMDKVIMNMTNAGVQEEWWCHDHGCGSWFTTFRNTLTGKETDKEGNEIGNGSPSLIHRESTPNNPLNLPGMANHSTDWLVTLLPAPCMPTASESIAEVLNTTVPAACTAWMGRVRTPWSM